MKELKSFNISDSTIGKIKVKSGLFDHEVDPGLVQFVVTMFMEEKRAKTAKVKTRAEVSGGGCKPWRQKGTGRARAGTIRSPLWVGGGVVHGPQNVRRGIKVNRKVKRQALLGLLNDRVDNSIVLLNDQLFEKQITKVRQFQDICEQLAITDQKILYVTTHKEARINTLNNIPNLKISSVFGLNVFDLLNTQVVVFDETSLKQTEETYSHE